MRPVSDNRNINVLGVTEGFVQRIDYFRPADVDDPPQRVDNGQCQGKAFRSDNKRNNEVADNQSYLS